jgi:ribokinase
LSNEKRFNLDRFLLLYLFTFPFYFFIFPFYFLFMSERSIDVYGLGQCAWDFIGEIDRYPPLDSKCEMSSMIMQGGGPVATALVALTRWGYNCSFCGVVGDDTFGRQIIDSLVDESLDTSQIIIRKGFDSQYAFIAAVKDGGKRTIFWRRPTGPQVLPEEVSYEMIRQARVFHTDGLFPAASIAAARIAKKTGTLVVTDAGTLREGMIELAKYSDYFIVSEIFAKALVHEDNPQKACKELQRLGPEIVGVTLGSKGYVVLNHNNWIEGEAYQVESVDTTGCGDLFHAGITLGALRGWDLRKSLDFSAWAAASVSQKLGGRAGIPTIEHFENLKDKNTKSD